MKGKLWTKREIGGFLPTDNHKICHNCLQEITGIEGKNYRKIRTKGKFIYIHIPKCPDGADSLAHYKLYSEKKRSVYSLRKTEGLRPDDWD